MTGPGKGYADRTEEKKNECETRPHSQKINRTDSARPYIRPQSPREAFPSVNTHSRWCLPDPAHTGGLWGEPLLPWAHAPAGCWGPRWSRRCSGSVWRDRHTWSNKDRFRKTQNVIRHQNVSIFCLPEGAEGLVIIDVSGAEGRYHGRTRVSS